MFSLTDKDELLGVTKKQNSTQQPEEGLGGILWAKEDCIPQIVMCNYRNSEDCFVLTNV